MEETATQMVMASLAAHPMAETDDNLGWAAGNGVSVKVWNDFWLSSENQEGPFGPATKESANMSVSDLFLPNTRVWNRGKIRELFPHLEPVILSIKPSTKGAPDKRIWLKKPSGVYSTKTGYYAAMDSCQRNANVRIPANINWISDLWALKTTCLPPVGIGTGPLAPWICWNPWIARNNRIFSNRIFTEEETSLKAIIDAKEWLNAQPYKAPTWVRSLKSLPRPNVGLVCKSDAAWSTEKQAAGLAWNFSDRISTQLSIAITSSAQIAHFVKSPLMAEGLAIRAAMEHALNLDFRRISFETDSQQLVMAIAGEASISDLHGVLSDIESISCLLESVTFSHIPSEENRSADCRAKEMLNHLVLNPVLI
ncbi:unnamed protein product, partial [Thlaspi arvense]